MSTKFEELEREMFAAIKPIENHCTENREIYLDYIVFEQSLQDYTQECRREILGARTGDDQAEVDVGVAVLDEEASQKIVEAMAKYPGWIFDCKMRAGADRALKPAAGSAQEKSEQAYGEAITALSTQLSRSHENEFILRSQIEVMQKKIEKLETANRVAGDLLREKNEGALMRWARAWGLV